MNTMDLEEMKQIWNQQYDEPLYAINEEALHKHILAKKKSTGHLANFTEIFLIAVNIIGGAIVIITDFTKESGNIFSYLLTGLMFVTAAFILVRRLRRKKGEKRFERSMLGDLNHAISNATYQVQLSRLMRWFILPLGGFTILALWLNQNQVWIVFLFLLLFILIYYVSGWECRMYENKKHELGILKNKLAEEIHSNGDTDQGQ